jgi:molybdopterin-guanine dinucleotide biosynthesis protein B
MVERELNVDSIVATYFTDEDLVLTEGYKSGSKEKIEICRKELKSEPLCNQADRLVAVVPSLSWRIYQGWQISLRSVF